MPLGNLGGSCDRVVPGLDVGRNTSDDLGKIRLRELVPQEEFTLSQFRDPFPPDCVGGSARAVVVLSGAAQQQALCFFPFNV